MGDVSRADAARARRYSQPLLSLDGRAVSPEAQALVSHCLAELVLPALPPQRPTSVASIRRAVEAILAGLVAAAGAEWGGGWARRPLSNASFTREPVGRVQFAKVREALDRAGLLDTAPGFLDRTAGGAGVDTRLRLSEAGRELAAEHGVTIGSARDHFATVSLSFSDGEDRP